MFFFQIKVILVKMRDNKVREVCHQPKVRKSPYLLIQVKDHSFKIRFVLFYFLFNRQSMSRTGCHFCILT